MFWAGSKLSAFISVHLRSTKIEKTHTAIAHDGPAMVSVRQRPADFFVPFKIVFYCICIITLVGGWLYPDFTGHFADVMRFPFLCPIYRPLGYEKVYLPLYKSFHIQGDDILCIHLSDQYFSHAANSSQEYSILWWKMTMTSFVFTKLANTMKYGGGVLYNLVFTEWRHWVTQNGVWGRGSYITLFSHSDVTAFHRIANHPLHSLDSKLYFNQFKTWIALVVWLLKLVNIIISTELE